MGLAGGGTDVSPFSDLYGGSILNATINLYAHASISKRTDSKIRIVLHDQDVDLLFDVQPQLPTNHKAALQAAVYNRMVAEFGLQPQGFELHTFIDAPQGSGLGTSSTLTVSVIGAFGQWLSLPLGEYDIAYLAYQIEREDLQMAGGKQDQYAATFGGINFMEFFEKNRVIINPLRVNNVTINELSHNIVLFYTQTSHNSSDIIKAQQANVTDKKAQSLEAMHKIKEQSVQMKEALLKGKLDHIGAIFNENWEYKKQMAEGISTELFEQIYDKAIQAGSSGGKISGAGGGGFIFFYCPNYSRYAVINALQAFNCVAKPYEFSKNGLRTWTIQ